MCLSIAHPGADGEDSMYVLDRYPGKGAGRCFEVLEPILPPELRREMRHSLPPWRWRLLPPPPFVRDPEYEPSSVASFAAVANFNGRSTIYISCDHGIGTYSFDSACSDSDGHSLAGLDDYLILASLVGKQSRGKGLGQGGRSAQPVPLTVVPESVVLELQDTPASSLFGGEDAVSALEVGPGSAGEASVSLLDQPGSPLGLGCVPVGVGPLDGPPSVPQSAGTAVGPILGLACSSSGGEGSELPVSDLCFLNSMFSATPSPLLQPPAHRSPAAPLPSPPSAPLAAPIRPAAFEPVRSSRLAAKPNSGMSTIEKARMVLLKKSGAILHDGPLGKEDLQKYRQIYAKPIPAPFVKAVEDLVEVNMPRKTAIPSQAPGLLVAVA
ncbi:hypothetical protein ACQ4PT_041911 [Festuca glaucescens]